jgi:FkbM family methyltransferase
MDELGFHRALHRPGRLLDIGAHDGGFTLPLAALPASQVEAFEPLPSAFVRLQAATAGLANVTLHALALGEAAGRITLTLPVLDGVPQEQWASIAKGYAGLDPRVTEQRHDVPMRSLDSFGFMDVTALKLDAEGGEYAVLRGAQETLRRCRPILSVEIEERHKPGATWAVPAFLDALGYDAFYEFWDDWRPMRDFDRATMQRASPNPAVFEASDPYIFVFYFLPREQAPRMLARLRGFSAG